MRLPRLCVCLVFFLLLGLSLLALPSCYAEIEPVTETDIAEASQIRCSGAKSRAARQSLEETLYPVLESEGYDLPQNCPLHPDNDMLRPLEEYKRVRKKDKWKCSICRRTFGSEPFLDLHLRRKHPEVFPEGPELCLADYCDILRCEEYEDKTEVATCSPTFMEKRKFECQALLHKCFPPTSSELAHKLNSQFTRLFCDPLSCDLPAAPKKSKWSVVGKVVWWILLGLAVVCVTVFYVVFWVYRKNKRLTNDLKRLSSQRRLSKLQFWKTKVKGY